MFLKFLKKKIGIDQTSKDQMLTPDQIDRRSTWGGRLPIESLSEGTLIKYYEILKKINNILKIIAFICLTAMFCLVIKLSLFQEYELYVFDDGTALT